MYSPALTMTYWVEHKKIDFRTEICHVTEDILFSILVDNVFLSIFQRTNVFVRNAGIIASVCGENSKTLNLTFTAIVLTSEHRIFLIFTPLAKE